MYVGKVFNVLRHVRLRKGLTTNVARLLAHLPRPLLGSDFTGTFTYRAISRGNTHRTYAVIFPGAGDRGGVCGGSLPSAAALLVCMPMGRKDKGTGISLFCASAVFRFRCKGGGIRGGGGGPAALYSRRRRL